MPVARAEPFESAYVYAFETYWHDVFRFALAWTNDWSAAEDLTQEAFLRLWRARASIRWSEPALPWLMVATRRLATDRFRSLRRTLTLRASSVPDERARDRWLDVQASMARLSRLERSALVLVAIEGHTYDAAAPLLGTSAGALRAAVSRARAKLEADDGAITD